MRSEDSLNNYMQLLKDKDPLVSSLIHQLIENRATIAYN